MLTDNGPIIVIKDDIDDQQLLEMVFVSLNYANKIFYFDNGEAALHFQCTMHRTKPLCRMRLNIPATTF